MLTLPDADFAIAIDVGAVWIRCNRWELELSERRLGLDLIELEVGHNAE